MSLIDFDPISPSLIAAHNTSASGIVRRGAAQTLSKHIESALKPVLATRINTALQHINAVTSYTSTGNQEDALADLSYLLNVAQAALPSSRVVDILSGADTRIGGIASSTIADEFPSLYNTILLIGSPAAKAALPLLDRYIALARADKPIKALKIKHIGTAAVPSVELAAVYPRTITLTSSSVVSVSFLTYPTLEQLAAAINALPHWRATATHRPTELSDLLEYGQHFDPATEYAHVGIIPSAHEQLNQRFLSHIFFDQLLDESLFRARIAWSALEWAAINTLRREALRGTQ